jgi:hypothetical protein
MEKVSRYLEIAGEPQSRTQIERGVSGKAEYVRKAIDALIADRYAEEIEGDRGARPVKLLRPFREADEWDEP